MTELQQKLESLGYTKSVQESYKIFHSTDTLFQKRIRDKKGTRYFINIWWYPTTVVKGHALNEGIQYSVQIHTEDDSHNRVVNIEFGSDYSVVEAENLCDELWETLGGKYYETNNYCE
jgi:hypothetical protein